MMRLAEPPDADLIRFGCQPETVEDASDLYREAARITIGLVETDEAAAEDVQRLLEHLDNDAVRIESLLAEMLARRDHWLRHIHGRDAPQRLARPGSPRSRRPPSADRTTAAGSPVAAGAGVEAASAKTAQREQAEQPPSQMSIPAHPIRG